MDLEKYLDKFIYLCSITKYTSHHFRFLKTEKMWSITFENMWTPPSDPYRGRGHCEQIKATTFFELIIKAIDFIYEHSKTTKPIISKEMLLNNNID